MDDETFEESIESADMQSEGGIKAPSSVQNLSFSQQVFLGVIVVGAFAILLVKLSKRSLKWDIRRYYAIKRHHWCYTRLFTQSYCSMCEAVIVASGGAFCDCCGVCTDSDDCIHDADKKLPCKPMTDAAEYTSHHWVKGNLPLSGCSCKVCGEECGEGVGLYDYICTWCDVTVHTRCKQSLSQCCDLGPMKEYIVPPHCVQLARARLRRGVSVRKVSLPLGIGAWSPVIVIGNVAAGSSEAETVLSAFRRVLNPVQVVDVSSVTVQEAARWCKMLYDKLPWDGVSQRRRVKLIIAGGDGTIAWVLDALHKKNIIQCVEVALVPLGTGNDLSRVLGWGGSLSSTLDAPEYLERVAKAIPHDVDRWEVHYTPSPPRPNLLTKVVPTRQVFMNNYLSIGVDALVTLRFHEFRESPFYLFKSRLLNKLIYFSYGTKDVIEHCCERLETKIKLFMDEKEVELPSMEALVVLNIPCWGAGVRPWVLGSGGKTAPVQSTSDGLLEVLAISSSFHICQMQMGLSEPMRLGQCSRIEVIVLDDAATLPMQVDGEPWKQQPGTINVTRSHTAVMLASNQ